MKGKYHGFWTPPEPGKQGTGQTHSALFYSEQHPATGQPNSEHRYSTPTRSTHVPWTSQRQSRA